MKENEDGGVSMEKMKNKEVNKEKVHCTAFCPLCGSDLYYYDNECICKNRDCRWTCGGCKENK